jgi:hypothetical protein
MDVPRVEMTDAAAAVLRQLVAQHGRRRPT